MATRTGVSGGHAPPSTLAAQLVENISASTKSSRSDDNSELRKLSATIQEVENNPGILKTSEDQLRHNHLLTYVFIRAVLGGIKLNDPFLDRKHLKSEVLQAISFLKLIIKETPAVLAYKTAEAPFEMRGDEPLWIWVFPKILRLLGHSRCLDLTADIETFFYELLDMLSSDNSLWCLVSSITVYLREIANALLLRLRDTNTIMNGRDESLQVTLPEDGTLELLVGRSTMHTIKQSTYTISGMAVGLRQASSLLKILGHPLVSQQHAMLPDDFFAAHRPWLADSLLSLRALQEGWQHTVPLGRSGVLQSTLNLLGGDFKGTKAIAKRKVYTILALHCADIVQNFSELTTSEGEQAAAAQQIFCCALLRLSHAALHDRSIGRLSMAKIVLPAESGLLIQNPSWDKSSDIWRSIQVLKETSGSTPPDTLSPDCQSALFADLSLQRQVERLGLKTTAEPVMEPEPKRRKLSQNSFKFTKLPKLVAQIYKILGADPGSSNFSLNWSFMNAYPKLSENDQCTVIDLLSRTCCLADEIIQADSKKASSPQCRRTLATFVRPPTSNNSDPSYLSRNLKTALSLLKNISEQAVTGFSETNIMAWGQLGRHVSGNELNLVLLQLLKYLGGNNSLIASCAFNERFALPWLVLLKKRDVVQKITEARREQDTYFCLMESSNNGPIMALLLIQDAPDPEEFIMSRLREFSSRFESSTIAEMMKSEAVAIILELLKAASDADEERKPRIVNALTWMATKVMAPSREPRSKKHSANIIGRFLESYMLGSISRLVDVINDRMLSAPPVEEQLQCLRAMEEMIRLCKAYVRGVVLLALEELVEYLKDNQGYLHSSAISEQPDSVVTTLLRSLLDCAAKVGTLDIVVAGACTQCIGLIGCLDSNRIETTRESKSMAVLHNFEDSQETTDFVLFILEEVLVKAFLSTTDTRLQGFLSFAMQDLMQKVDLQSALASSTKIPNSTRSAEGNSVYRKWIALPESVREVLSPFLTSRYLLAPAKIPPAEYPIFQPGKSYVQWVRVFVLDLLQRPLNEHARLVFEPLSRLIRVKDVSVAEFLLPYLVIHVIVGNKSTQNERDRVTNELVNILRHQIRDDATYAERDDMKLYCEAVFRVFDYAMKWVQENGRNAKSDLKALDRVKSVVGMISPELRSQRAMDCKEYSRALFYLEHHAQELELKQGDPSERTRLLERLQDIYTQIDEPDGLDGISARLHVLDVNQQILSHRKAGRWTAAQTWYEIKLAEEPNNVDIQVDLLTCLQQSGQHDVLLNHVEGMHLDVTSENRIVPFAVEAAWATSRWDTLSKYAGRFHGDFMEDFNVGIAKLFDSMRQGKSTRTKFTETLDLMRKKIASGLTYTATSSLQASHELMLRCHILTDIELITQEREVDGPQHQATLKLLERRLEVLGAYVYDKQYVLSIRRAAMQLSQPIYSDIDISSLWLSTAKLARKANSMQQSLNAVLHASKLGDDSAVIENAKLLWKDGHPRKAIQVLQGAIDANKFATQVNNSTSSSKGMDMQQRYLTARAQLTLAKWLDAAGQTHVINLREKYQQAPKTLSMWEKGHFFLGRHYKKLMESEQTLKLDHQSDAYLQGEIARLVIENYLRSLSYGTKYLFQTLPRILTLWLELGAQVDKPPEGKISVSRELHKRRVEQLNMLHKFLDKYIIKLPAFIFYTALPQIVARIAHPSQHVFDRLKNILVKVVEAHPRQALWGLFGIMTTKQATERRERGQRILQTLRSVSARVENGSYDLKTLLRMGEKLAEQLLLACNNGNFQSNRTTKASITRDLNFNHKCTPCPLVVPIEACLTATLPTLADNVRRYKAFSRDVVTIDSFLDEVLVLGSLAKPRRLTARGSDGKNYMLLIKPKDDLRTDQRLMEFNAMINRSLKRDAESSRRQLYIRTYAVTPLNEECGIIEWVDGLKTLRDILLEQYKMRGTHPDYNAIKRMMKDAVTGTSNIHLFTEGVLGTFPPVLHHWFIEQFPHPAVWFAARLKYTRSCAVMSMVGTILGLGDRHGENVLLEKDNGGIFHVDFNCLFDKGRTFGEPERVPFRLTHNMVTAMGMHGYEGPFRACSELSLGILRQQEETLMTILEAFIYDPTLDLQKVKKSSRAVVAPGEVRLEPPYVVDSIKRKVRGLLPNESIPLGVEGYVEELISQAVDPRNLSAMYIGWCPFL
ncbi:hypothetical protein VD0001_g4888 [Verticillium dahliae]|nr:hypothetical protein VD0001_g4888 [Verticillium dahliae]